LLELNALHDEANCHPAHGILRSMGVPMAILQTHGPHGRTIARDIPISHLNHSMSVWDVPLIVTCHRLSGVLFLYKYFPTALLPYRPTALPPYRPTALPPCRPTTLLPCCPTAIPPCRPTALPPCHPTALLPYCAALLLVHLQYCHG
jgi:hypothetical protein